MTDIGAQDRAAGIAEVYRVLGPLYRRAQQHVERDAPSHGLTVGSRAVLEQLRREGPRTVPEIARAQDISRQYVQRVVDAGVADGLLRTVENPRHRRSRLVEVTPAGEAAIAGLLAHERDQLAEVGADTLTQEDLDACLHVLRTMLAGLDGVGEVG